MKILTKEIINSKTPTFKRNVDGGYDQIKYTQEQQAAIDFRGGSLLVSAAAGSGKTKVLVERLLGHIDEGVNIDEFLVITYTRAAALELREKIHEELLTRLAQSPSMRLRRQSILCRGAAIDTIHTICGEILRENAHIVRLPPDFRIADGSESGMIMTEVADTVITTVYQEIDRYPDFSKLIDIIAQGRDDKQLIEMILSVYNKLKSKANYKSWLNEQIDNQNLGEVTDISETIYGSYMLNKFYKTADYWLSEMQSMRDDMIANPDFEIKYSASVENIIAQITAFVSAFSDGWDEVRSKSDFEFISAKPIKGYEDLKEIRKNCIDELRKISEELSSSSKEHARELGELGETIALFYKLIIVFDEAYADEKRRRGVTDFSDLEHLTLSLLVDESTGKKTELARNLSKRYKEIMIDEYQDVNEVQELIFKAISKDESNIFMVGDVKQAIYRFRLADPSIFLSKYKKFEEYDYAKDCDNVNHNDDYKSVSIGNDIRSNAGGGTTIHLSKNFRSQTDILNATNDLFKTIMSNEFGELDYTKKEWLVPGRTDEHANKYGQNTGREQGIVDIDIIDICTKDASSDEESPSAIKLEAEYIANEIEKLTDGTHLIPDKNGGVRPIKHSDIVILLRSMKGKAWLYASALSERDIQTELPGGEGFFETIEISAALALLSIIDNPHQDIPLAAVIGGPVYGFTSDELAQIRISNRDATYYEAIKKLAEHERWSDKTCCKCKKILSDIEELRLVMADMPADRFIWHVYNKTGILGLVSAMNGGERRRNNLILLAESARRFEQSEYKGLFGFLVYIRKLRERGEELSSGLEAQSSAADSMDAVRIMSIHKSKGLEFPVVFLANTAKQFNYTDMRKNVVFHTEFGIGTMLVDKERRTKHTTLPRTAIQTKLRDEMLSEELRVLYVAMTRAREKLIITATLKDASKIVEKIDRLSKRNIENEDADENKMASQALLSLKNSLEWMLAGISVSRSNAFSVNIISSDTVVEVPTDSIQEENDIGEKVPDNEPDTVHDVHLAKNIECEHIKRPIFFDSAFEYKYQNAVDLPSKLTVTGIVTQQAQDIDAEKAEWTTDEAGQSLQTRTPEFVFCEKKMTGAQRGITLHLIMQHMDLESLSLDCDIGSVEKELKRLENLQIISTEQLNEISKDKLLKFFKSHIGTRLLNAKNVNREFKFSLLSPAEIYFESGGNDEILIQGVIDCYFEEDDKIVVIDFKTDRVTSETVNTKAERYAPQLNIYAEALTRITGKIVKEKIIYFFSIDSEYHLCE